MCIILLLSYVYFSKRCYSEMSLSMTVGEREITCPMCSTKVRGKLPIKSHQQAIIDTLFLHYFTHHEAIARAGRSYSSAMSGHGICRGNRRQDTTTCQNGQEQQRSRQAYIQHIYSIYRRKAQLRHGCLADCFGRLL